MTRLQSEGTPPIGITTFHYGPEPVPVTIKPEHGVHHLYAPRRTVLDRILVEAAEAAGAEVHHGVLLSQLQFDLSGRVVGAMLRRRQRRGDVRADLVIGADGRNSTVAKLVAAETYLKARASSALVYGYFEGLPDDGLHWYFGDRAAAGVIPTNHGQHCVFVGLPHEQFAAAFRGDVERGFLGQLDDAVRSSRPRSKAQRSRVVCEGFRVPMASCAGRTVPDGLSSAMPATSRTLSRRTA